MTGGAGEGNAVELVQVSIGDDGSVLFTCRVCDEQCPARPGLPLAEATREFLEMHPACADPAQHEDGCPAEPDVAVGA